MLFQMENTSFSKFMLKIKGNRKKNENRIILEIKNRRIILFFRAVVKKSIVQRSPENRTLIPIVKKLCVNRYEGKTTAGQDHIERTVKKMVCFSSLSLK
jgi:hypothetical protein